jgi:hypothetical protein
MSITLSRRPHGRAFDLMTKDLPLRADRHGNFLILVS